MKSGEKSATLHHLYEALCIVVSTALGGKREEADPSTAPQNEEEMLAAVDRIFG